MLTAIAVSLVGLYIVMLVVLYACQRDLIFAGHSTQGLASSQVTPAYGEELVRLPADGTTVAVLFCAAQTANGVLLPRGEKCPTVIFLNGNGSCIAYSLDIADAMRRHRVNVVLVDYPGYGLSGGKASEIGAYAAADAAYEYVCSRSDCDSKQIVSAGWSLGSSVAAHLASTRPVAGLALWSAFTSMAEVSHGQYPIVPTPLIRLILKYPFPTLREIAKVKAPIFMAHGTIDRLVPIAMPRRLATAAGGPVTWVPVASAGHNDIFDVGGKPLIDKFGRWIAALPSCNPQTAQLIHSPG